MTGCRDDVVSVRVAVRRVDCVNLDRDEVVDFCPRFFGVANSGGDELGAGHAGHLPGDWLGRGIREAPPAPPCEGWGWGSVVSDLHTTTGTTGLHVDDLHTRDVVTRRPAGEHVGRDGAITLVGVAAGRLVAERPDLGD